MAWLTSADKRGQDRRDRHTCVVGSKDTDITVWDIAADGDGGFTVGASPSHVITGMGAPVDFIVPSGDRCFVTGSLSVSSCTRPCSVQININKFVWKSLTKFFTL